jgi:hypothetical protein
MSLYLLGYWLGVGTSVVGMIVSTLNLITLRQMRRVERKEEQNHRELSQIRHEVEER